MKVYLAGEGGHPWLKDDFYDFFRLDSYLSAKKKREGNNFYKYNDFILDSGVFTYLTSKKDDNIDWDKYAL